MICMSLDFYKQYVDAPREYISMKYITNATIHDRSFSIESGVVSPVLASIEVL